MYLAIVQIFFGVPMSHRLVLIAEYKLSLAADYSLPAT